MFVMELMIRKAVEVIQNHPSEEPLFLYLAYQAPHMNIQVFICILLSPPDLSNQIDPRSPLQCTWMSTQGREFTRRGWKKTTRRSTEPLQSRWEADLNIFGGTLLTKTSRPLTQVWAR